MPFEMALWKVTDGKLDAIESSRLEQEQRLEDWIAKDPAVLGMEIALIGRQVQTAYGGRLDLLALDRDANCVVLELKRDRTPREVVAQLLDYGAWVRNLDYSDLDEIALRWKQTDIAALFEDTFGEAIPDTVNAGHSLIVVASELDDSSERIISYLTEEHGVSINAVFFTYFQEGGSEFMGRAWLRDPVETIERSEARKRAPWSGYWFVNVGEREHRNWDDNRKYGYIGAGQGERVLPPPSALEGWGQVLRLHERPWLCRVRRGNQGSRSGARLHRRGTWKAAPRSPAARAASYSERGNSGDLRVGSWSSLAEGHSPRAGEDLQGSLRQPEHRLQAPRPEDTRVPSVRVRCRILGMTAVSVVSADCLEIDLATGVKSTESWHAA